MYNHNIYNSEKFYKLDDAIKQIPIIKEIINKIKQNEDEEHKLKPITRNKNNQAIIIINNIECIVDGMNYQE